jgi:DNA-binding response OmpR family regulator
MNRKKILIIDDDAQLVELIRLIFVREGALVYAAGDGHQGLQAFFTYQPNLVILDVMMPGMDGWHVCSRLRRESEVPILLLSATGRDEDVARGMADGADDYVTKPFSPRALVTRARALLQQRQTAMRAARPFTTAEMPVS